MKMKIFIATMAASAVLLGTALLYSTSSSKAPEATFVLLDGSLRTANDFRGKVTLVNFWATSCATCVAEMPMIVRAHEKYRSRGYETLAVAMSYTRRAMSSISPAPASCRSLLPWTTPVLRQRPGGT